MNWLITIYGENEILEHELRGGQTITVGSGGSDILSIGRYGLEPGHITLTGTDTGVHLSSRRSVLVGEDSVTNRVLAAGDIVRVARGIALTFFEKRCDISQPISLARKSEVTIGRTSHRHISLAGNQVSSSHATLRRKGGGWEIADDGSRNGTFVHGKRTETALLRDNDLIFIGGWIFRYRKDELRFVNTLGKAILSPELAPLSASPASDIGETAYPYFQRSPRLKPSADVADIEILAPPRIGEKPSISWMSILLPPVLMIVVMIVIASLSDFGAASLMFTVPMSIIGVVVALVNYNAQTKKWRLASDTAHTKYSAYLKEREVEITAAESAYITALDSVNPGPDVCMSIAARRDRRLWERSVSDDDFLTLRIGTGTVASNVSVKLPHTQFEIEDDPLLAGASKLRNRHEYLSGVPVTTAFAETNIAGLTGSREAIQKVAWTVLCGVAAHHSYEDVKIAVVFSEQEKRQWDFLRWLPHVWDETRHSRMLACNNGEASALLRGLDDVLKGRARKTEGQDKAAKAAPHYFVVLADKNLAESAGVSLLPSDSAFGMTVLYAYGDMSRLPGECGIIIECGEKSGTVHNKTGNAGRVQFTPDRVSARMMDAFSRSLAPVRFRSAARQAGMPDYVPLLIGFGADKVEELDVLGRYNRSRPFESIAAPIGIKENGEVFAFDIHEKGMGPHGIVAGATRWGKSETLTTWLLSTALNFHPQEVSFVLIDFKGDGLSGILMDLPHVAGKISNVHDISSIERNLRSLQGELLRRQRVFMDTKQENIHKYQEAHRSGRVNEPMPYLIIVIDEFAELKTQFPDQMNNFIQFARVGGSLGVYLALATQSPGGGIVSGQVSANSRFRICLKTAEAGESKDILGTTDAFQITTRGRAFVKVGNNEVYEQVQTFFSKAPYRPGSGAKGAATKINVVELDGSRVRPEVYDKTVGVTGTEFGEGRAVAQYIKETLTRAGVGGARQVWTEALPERIRLDAMIVGREAFKDGAWQAVNDGFAAVVGLLDDPDNQCQYPLVLNFDADGHQAVYGAPQSGKTEFLRTALLSAALTYTPEQVQIVVLEFGASVMKPFETLPHTLMVADGNNADKVKQAEQFLMNQLEGRKRRFSEYGVGTLNAYRELTGEADPALLIAVDSMASLYTMYPDFLDTLTVIAREGAGFGLYLLMTASSQGSFMYRLAQYIKCSYALQLTDKGDYRQLVGGSGRVEPGHFPGRGFAKGPLEFQTALCSDSVRESERVKEFRNICVSMSSAWQGGKPDVAHAMSGGADAEELSYDKVSVQIGFDKISGKPYSFDFEGMNGCVIAGVPGSGKTNILAWLVRALSEDVDTSLYIYEKSDMLRPIAGNARISRTGAEFDGLVDEIAGAYRDRSGGDTCPRIAVVIDDFSSFYEEIADETADKLDDVIRGGARCGIFFYIAGDKDALQRFDNLSVKTFSLCLEKGNAVALGGRLRDYGMFNPLHEADDVLIQPHEGCVISGGKVTAVKLAAIKEAEANA